LCREEAAELSSLKPELDAHGVTLYAVVHETRGVDEFQKYFKGDIYLDKGRVFYGPKQRWMFLSGFVRPSVWSSFFRVKDKKIPGNMQGEGRLLGGVFVLGPGKTGVTFEHRESEFGDHANLTELMDSVKTLKPNAKL